MKKKRKAPDRDVRQPRTDGAWTAAIRGFFQVVGAIVDRFGWPGFILGVLLLFVGMFATVDQKRRIIDMYGLGDGISSSWPIIAVSVFWVIVLRAQQYFLQRRIRALEDENRTLGIEKSRLQEQAIGKPLRHGKDFEMEEE